MSGCVYHRGGHSGPSRDEDVHLDPATASFWRVRASNCGLSGLEDEEEHIKNLSTNMISACPGHLKGGS